MPREKSHPKVAKIKKTEAKKVTEKPVSAKTTKVAEKASKLSVPVFSLKGEESGQMTLPEELFGAKVNKTLLSQAMRVYLNNQKSHFAHTKTRSEVRGSTKKIYRQKGTGGARHGSKRAPIFVGGGVALGPKFRKVILELPQKMKQRALLSALSLKLQEGEVIGVEGLEKASGKTKQMQKFTDSLVKNNSLLVLGKRDDKVERASRNLKKLLVSQASELNVLTVLAHQTLMLTQEAVESLTQRFSAKESGKD